MRFEGQNDGTGKYYEPIDTLLRCKKCGRQEYVKGYKTLVKTKVEDYDSVFEDTIKIDTGRVVDSKLVSQRRVGSHFIYEDININEDGYRHTFYPYGKKHNWCKQCAKKHRRNLTIIVALIVAVILLGALINGVIVEFGSGRAMQEMIFEKSVEKYEAQTDNVDMPDGSTVFRDGFLQEIAETDDYTMYIFGSDTSVIQKSTVLGKASYYFNFKGGEYAELDGKKYILDEDIIYELGQENKAYFSSSGEYAPLLEKLNGFYAEKCCAQGSYTKEVLSLDDDEKDINLIYGDGVTILDYQGGYFEKTADRFISIKDGKRKEIASIPKDGDFTEVK